MFYFCFYIQLYLALELLTFASVRTSFCPIRGCFLIRRSP